MLDSRANTFKTMIPHFLDLKFPNDDIGFHKKSNKH